MLDIYRLIVCHSMLPFPQVSEVIEHAKFALQTKYNFSVPVKAIVGLEHVFQWN